MRNTLPKGKEKRTSAQPQYTARKTLHLSCGRYYNDTQVLDLNTLEWAELPLQGLHPCAGHQLVNYGGSILLVGGNGKRHNAEPVNHVAVRTVSLNLGELLPNPGVRTRGGLFRRI